MKKDFKNILVVRTDRIGDVVVTTPAIRALRVAYPKAKITVLLGPVTRDLLEGDPLIDEILIDDKLGTHKGISGFLNLVREIAEKKFDLAVVFHTKKRTNLLCFLSGIPYRLGYRNNKFGFLLTHKVLDSRHKGEKHEAEYCLDVLKGIDVESQGLDLDIVVDDFSNIWLEKFFEQNAIKPHDTIIAIHPGASDPAKRLSEKRFAEIMGDVYEKYNCKFILVGSPENRPLSKKVITLCNVPVIDITGLTSVGQLVSLLNRCSMLISNDSGPVHIAAALKTPVVSIFTRNQPGINSTRWRPLSDNSQVVSVSADINRDISFQKAGNKGDGVSEVVTAAQVLQAVDGLFKL